MSSKFFISVSTVLIFSCTNSKVTKSNNDWSEMNLKGKVKQIKETTYPTVKKGETNNVTENSDNYKQTIYSFNPKGQLVTISKNAVRIENSSNGYEVYEYVAARYLYDEQGNKTELDLYKEDGGIQGKRIYIVNSKGEVIEEKYFSGDGTYNGKVTYSYDNSGFRLERISIPKEEGNELEKTTYKYDTKGNMIEERTGNHILTYKYDAKGNEIEIKGTVNEKYIYTYDKNNNWTIKEYNNLDFNELTTFKRQIIYY